MEDMDTYYTVYNWELPNQIPMKMPTKSQTASGNISKGSMASSAANSSSPQVPSVDLISEQNCVLDDSNAVAEAAPIVSDKAIEGGSNNISIQVDALVMPVNSNKTELLNVETTQTSVAGISTEPMNSTGIFESKGAIDIPPMDSHQETESISGSNPIIYI